MLLKEEKVDLRILRTRRLLVQAMTELLEEKDLQSITISDIAERAMINRATFYAHFADKYDLFATIVRDFFQGVLEAEVSNTAVFNRHNLEKLALSVINAVSQLQKRCTPGPRDQVQPMIETELQKQLYAFVLGWLDNDGDETRVGNPEITASVVSWSLFGTAMQYEQNFPEQAAEALAARTITILVDGLEGAPYPHKIPKSSNTVKGYLS